MPKIGAAPFAVAELFQNCSEFFPTAGSSEFRGWSVYNLQIALRQTGKAEFVIGHCRTSVAADSRLRNNRCHGRSSNFDCPNQQALRGFLVSASTRLTIVCVVSIATAALAIALGSRYYVMRSVGLSEVSRVAYPCLFSECRAVPRLPAEAAAERIPPQFPAVLADFRQRYPEYDDIADSDLVDSLYRQFYSDMSRAEFDQKLGLKPVDTSELTSVR